MSTAYRNEPVNATLSNVASSASSVPLLSADKRRVSFYIYNASTQVLYIKFGATASATSYTHQLAANTGWTPPYPYNGRVDGIWASANGNARITEFF